MNVQIMSKTCEDIAVKLHCMLFRFVFIAFLLFSRRAGSRETPDSSSICFYCYHFDTTKLMAIINWLASFQKYIKKYLQLELNLY